MLLLQSTARTWPATAVHDTVARVLREAAFRRSVQQSFADVFMLWLADWFGRFMRIIKHVPSGRSIAIGLGALIVIAVVARAVLATRARGESAERTGRRRGGVAGDDPWQTAEQLMSQGRYEEAAHAIYRGVLNGLTLGERVRLDPSKTSGDYARELRRRGSSSFVAFRAFVRRFDVAVYGHGGCDSAALMELRELSAPFRAKARVA